MRTGMLGMLVCCVLLLATGGCGDSKMSWDVNGKLLSIHMDSPFPLELKRIDPGSFTMGSAPGQGTRFSIPENEKPEHEVTFREPFYIAVHETTNEHYRRFDPEHDSSIAGAALPEGLAATGLVGSLNEDRNPVVGVSHDEAERFCEWLSERSGLSVRLPTEAEWEYACKAGGESAYCWGDSRSESQQFANLADADTAELLKGVKSPAPRSDGELLSSRVASFRPNGNGLYDMAGNVAEWCQDIYVDNYNAAAPDGSATVVGGNPDVHVVRGGSWADGTDDARSAAREGKADDTEDAMTGFRIVVEMPAMEVE